MFRSNRKVTLSKTPQSFAKFLHLAIAAPFASFAINFASFAFKIHRNEPRCGVPFNRKVTLSKSAEFRRVFRSDRKTIAETIFTNYSRRFRQRDLSRAADCRTFRRPSTNRRVCPRSFRRVRCNDCSHRLFRVRRGPTAQDF